IPFSETFADYYSLGELTHREYPTLVAEDQSVDTIAVPAVLAVFNWAKGSDRYPRVERFVRSLFTKWDKFREPPRHPNWRGANLAAGVHGWIGWGGATEILKRISPKDVADVQPTSSEFSAFLNRRGLLTPSFTDEQREALFRAFLQWREKQRAIGQ